jgi:hypothetical protein
MTAGLQHPVVVGLGDLPYASGSSGQRRRLSEFFICSAFVITTSVCIKQVVNLLP